MTTVSTQAFYECTALNTVTLPQSITKIDTQAFYKCSSLNAIVIPENVKYIEAYAFYLCPNLTTVELKDPSGWQFESTLLDASLLADPAEVAVLLTKTYYDADWKKKD